MVLGFQYLIEGKPIVLVFDCISYGKHEINCMDGLTLKKVLGELSRRIRLPQSKIVDVQYRYESLNKAKKIRELNLPLGGSISQT